MSVDEIIVYQPATRGAPSSPSSRAAQSLQCAPRTYSKSPKPQTLVQLAEDGQSAVADTDVVWIPQNFQNTILARYHDYVVKDDDRWLVRRREEFPVQYRPGPPPMSGAAMSVSSATMLSGG